MERCILQPGDLVQALWGTTWFYKENSYGEIGHEQVFFSPKEENSPTLLVLEVTRHLGHGDLACDWDIVFLYGETKIWIEWPLNNRRLAERFEKVSK